LFKDKKVSPGCTPWYLPDFISIEADKRGLWLNHKAFLNSVIANSLLRILNKYSIRLVVFNTGGDKDEING
jgi:hypothetical protein